MISRAKPWPWIHASCDTMQTWSVSPIKPLSIETRNIWFHISHIKPSMITNLGCQFDIYRKRESQLHNCFYQIGLWACLWSTFWIAKWFRWFSLHQLAEWFHESHRAKAFSLPGDTLFSFCLYWCWWPQVYIFLVVQNWSQHNHIHSMNSIW